MTPPGDIRAYDILTGKLLWQFHTIPRPGEFGYETNPPDGWKYMGGANNWGEMSHRRGARHRLHPDRIGDGRLLGRRSARPESLRQLHPRARRPDRQAPLALPDDPSRPLGPRQRLGAAARDRAAQRPERGRRRARRQDRLPLRVQSRDRRAALADRRASGHEGRRARASSTRRRSRSRRSRRRSRGSRSRKTTSTRTC